MVSLSNNGNNNIRVRTTSNNVGVNSDTEPNINANTNGNSQRAKSWAVGEGLIEGQDYSAKYYAGQAKQSEEIATDAISQIGTSVEDAQGYAQNASNSASAAESSEDNAQIWAEGSDEDVEELGGTHSAKNWAQYVVNNAPTVTVTQTTTGATVTATDLQGTTTATILNGAKGDKGDTGAQGEQGPQGLQGIQGEKGEKGDKGDKGDTGSKGDTGAQGPKGDKGDTGSQGPQGLQGEQGPQGAQGAQGPQGVSIVSNELYSSSGLYDTYRQTFSDGSHFDYVVKNGADGGYTLPIASANTLGGIKVGNNLSIDANGVLSASASTTVDQTYNPSSTNAQSGVAIAGAGFLKNTATGSNALTILGNASSQSGAVNIGYGSNGTGTNAVAIGKYASASQSAAVALGYGASAKAYNAIQLGTGTNSTAYTFSVGLGNNNNYQLLDGTTGLIPDARISTNIARASQIPSLSGYATETWVGQQGFITSADLANVATSGSYNDLTNKPIIDTEISTTSNNAVQNKAIPNYIVSRGENLVTNGFASLGNNYNFKSFTFDGSDTYGAGGCFSMTSTPAGSRSSILTNELMPVDITQSYKLSYAVKNSTSTATYDYLNMYDIDGYVIAKGHVSFVEGTTTTLAQELKDGDTKVYLTNISNTWHTGEPGTSGANYYRGLIFWNYTNSFGYQYPIEYYSRNWWYDLWNDDNDVDAVNGVITLSSPWNHGTFPAGTSVSQGNTSGGYVYGNANYTPPVGEWTEKSFIFTPNKFMNGTSYIRLGWLYNYSQRPSNVFKISSVSLTQNLSIKDALTKEDYATTTTGGVVKISSAYGTNITNTGIISTYKASNSDIDTKTQQYRPIVPYNLDYAVKTSLTTNTISLTNAEKQAAQQWLGISGRNIGEIVQSTLPLTDAGLHLLDGTLLSGSGIYADFVDYIADLHDSGTSPAIFATEADWQTIVSTYGSCGKFVYDNVNNTVRLPKVSDILQGTTDLTALGNLVEAGLPNITGTINLGDTYNGAAIVGGSAGAFYRGNAAANNYAPSTSTGTSIWSFGLDASRSSSIYGNSSTVQPQTIKVLLYIVIATTAKTEIEVDIDEIATDLNGKADVDGSNMNASVKNFDGQWVSANVVLSQTTAVGTYTLDVSNYLPVDNYKYEVLLDHQLWGSGNCYSDVSSTISPDIVLCVSSTAVTARSNVILPVDTDRIIYYGISNAAAGGAYLRLRAYRRIGTNQ